MNSLLHKSTPKKIKPAVFFLIFLSVITTVTLQAQVKTTDEDAFFVRKIHDSALTEGQCYTWLHHLTKEIGPRLSGSPQAAAAVEYTYQILDTLGLA